MTFTLNRSFFARFISVLLLICVAAAAAFFVGQSTRVSDTKRIAQRTSAVNLAVGEQKAVDAKVLTARIKTDQKHEVKSLHKLHKIDIKKAKKAAAAAQQAGYNSGQSAGYSSGYSSGNSTGYSQGSADGYNGGYMDGSFDQCIYDGTC
jgi:flagellar biosynthesis/type III secretory pathway protein FliH